ncbi:hypothetical protein [Pseudomonas entomophila]|uniref:hypothetical protein n=1 Tax=Pseudomonas entomophila TaxID=312306 RepID=UPI001F00A8ED|nr:hypothetical protein [Pseudomonas entomophila]MCG8295592.1 hypothetical protein [Pseudomonas entomophila]
MITPSLASLSQSESNLIGLGPDLSRQERGDVLDLLDHAEGFANRAFDRQEVLETGARGGLSSSFMLTPCYKDAQGQIHFAVHAFRLNTTVEMRDFDFWTEVRRGIVVWKIETAYRFDRERFTDFRGQTHEDPTRWSRRALLELPID